MSDFSRTRNSIRNIIWGVVFRGSSVLLPFVNRTVIINTLGMEYIGISSLFSSILSVLSLAELGVGSAILFSMYKPVAEHDYETANALLFYYRKVYRWIGTIILVAGILICFKLDWFISGELPEDINVEFLFLMYLANTVVSYFFFAYLTVVLVANQREDISYRINIVISVLCALTQLLVLIIFKNYYIYVLLMLLSSVFYNILCYKAVKKSYPKYYAAGELGISSKKNLRKQIVGLVIGKISIISRNSLDGVIISASLGLIPAAIYGNYYTIMNALFSLVFLLCSGIRASVGNKIATRGVNDNYKDMMMLSYGFYCVYSMCTVCLFCLYQSFMELWVGTQYVASLSLAMLMSLYFFLFCSVGIISQYWEASGLFWENKNRFIVEAIFNLVMSLIFVRFWGINGVILATVVSMGLITGVVGPIIAFKYYFKSCSILNYFFIQFRYFIMTIILCVICYFLTYNLGFEGILGLVARCLICMIISVGANVLFFWNLDSSKLFRGYLHKIIGTYV